MAGESRATNGKQLASVDAKDVAPQKRKAAAVVDDAEPGMGMSTRNHKRMRKATETGKVK